mgnify:CR=1 FL=1
MTKKKKEKYETLIVKLAEIKYLLKMLSIDTEIIDNLLDEIRERKELDKINSNKKPNQTKSIPSCYVESVQIKNLINKLKVYKTSETTLNKIINKFNVLNKTLENKPHWKLNSQEEK